MSAEVTSWNPDPKTLPAKADPRTVYLLPSMLGAGDSRPGQYMFAEHERFLPKYARTHEIPVRFSKDGEERLFLSEYSTDASTLAITLATVGWAIDWIIAIVVLAVSERATRSGSPESAPILSVSIAELHTNGTVIKGINIAGPSPDVIDALKALRVDGGATGQ